MNQSQKAPASFGSDQAAAGVGPTLGALLKDLQDMVRGEMQLARAEIRDDVSTAGKGLAALATALVVGLTGFIFLMLGATYVLNIWMRMWIAAAIVGAVLVVLGLALVSSGKKKLSATSLRPDQTIGSMKENQAWAKQQISSVSK